MSQTSAAGGGWNVRSAQIGCAPCICEEVIGRSSLCLQPAVGEREPVQPSCVENFGLGTSRPSAAPGLQQPAAKRRNTSATGGCSEEGGWCKSAAQMSVTFWKEKLWLVMISEWLHWSWWYLYLSFSIWETLLLREEGHLWGYDMTK